MGHFLRLHIFHNSFLSYIWNENVKPPTAEMPRRRYAEQHDRSTNTNANMEST